jgi:ketosteroid isomerase-like protein
MSDEEQVRRTMVLWAHRNDDKDADGWSQLFTENGKFINARRTEFVGRAAIRKNLQDRTDNNPPDRHTTHVMGYPVVEISGDTARAEADYVCYARIGDAPEQILTVGRCIGHLERHGDSWLLSEFDNRAYVHTWLTWAT